MRHTTALSIWAVAVAAAIVLAFPATAAAMTMREGNSVTIAKGEIISDDLYAFGNTITIDGVVNGDVIAAGQTVVINGDVRGSVAAAGQLVRIAGTVSGSVRAGAQIVDIGGGVGGDVVAGASRVSVSGKVGRDLVVGAQDVDVSGTVGRNVMTGSTSLTVSGDVGGDVEAHSTNVVVTRQGTVAGSLDYWSTQPAAVQGTVSGATTRHEPPVRERDQTPNGGGLAGAVLGAVLAWVQSFVGMVILGLVLVLALHRPMQLGSQAVFDRPWPSLGVGLLVFFATPMAGGFIFVFGLFVGAWWLAFVLFTVYWLLLLAGMVVGSLTVGRAILRATSRSHEPALAWSALLGIAIVWVVAIVPVLGWLAAWVVMMLGTGALVLLWMGKAEKPVAAPALAVAQGLAQAAPVAPVVPQGPAGVAAPAQPDESPTSAPEPPPTT